MIMEDTVIDRDRRMTMEDILARDQRTTSHRVLDRGSTCVCPKVMLTTRMTATTVTPTPTPTPTPTTSTMTAIARMKNINCQDDLRRPNDACVTRKERNDTVQRQYRCNSCLVPSSYDDRGIRRSRHNATVTTTTWLRLGSLLVTLLAVSVQGAPTMTLDDKRQNSPPKWVNPCGLAAEDVDSSAELMDVRDAQLLDQVLTQAKTALLHAQLFRDDFVRRTFSIDFADLHSQWKENHYDWLPGPKEIPKQLGEKLALDFLETLQLDTALLDAYEYMQKFAVGLEQIVWDQEDHRLEFRSQFKDTEYKLQSLLCELQVALVERAVTPRPDVTRAAMSAEYREMAGDATFRNLRDWLIFRDYMNALEYVVQIFEHLRHGLES